MAGKKKASKVTVTDVAVSNPAGTALVPFVLGDTVRGSLQPYKPKEILEADPNAPKAPAFVEGWEEIQPEFTDTFHFAKVGDHIMGTLVEVKRGVGQNDGAVYVLEVGQGANVRKLGLWEKTSLELKMKSAKVGDRVFIQLLGMRPSKNFSQPWYDFRVRIARGRG